MGKGEELLEAVKQQDVATVNKLVHKGKSKILGSTKKVHINYQDSEGYSPLHQAAFCGNPELIHLLLEARADVDIKDAKGMRPLHYAAWQGKLEPVTVLLTSHARANVAANDGSTPLHLAAQYGHYLVSELLLQYGGDPALRNKRGKSALDLTCEFGRLNVTELFLNSNGCAALLEPSPLDMKQEDFTTPLHLAACNGHKDIIRALLQTGIDINWTTKSGTCLHEAVAHGKPEVVRLLIDCGINVTKQNSNSQTALDLINKGGEVTPEISSIRQMLTDAQPGSMKVRAINDFKNVYDATSLAFKSGMLITVMEKNPNGNWKGKLRDPTTGQYKVGYFPAAYVEPQQNRHNSSVAEGSDDSGIHPSYDDDSQSSSSSPNSHYPGMYNPVLPRSEVLPPNPGPRSPMTMMDSNHNVPKIHKYINTEPQKHRLSPQIPLITPNVVNPSYEDVITSKQNSDPRQSPITFSKSTQEMSMQNPHINNPGYEDVLVQSSATNQNGKLAPLSYSNSSTSYSQHSTVPYNVKSHHLHQHPVGNNSFYAAANNVPYIPHDRSQHATQPFHERNNNIRRDYKPELQNKVRHHSTGSKQSLDVSFKTQMTDPNMEAEKIQTWLSSMGLQQYATNFVSHGYDMPTISKMNPADLTAVGVSKPVHRKKISNQISKLSAPNDVYNHMPASVEEWCQYIGMPQYASIFYKNGINSIDKVMVTTWEDLQEMNIEKLGHQKKILLGITKLKQIAKNIENNHHGSPTSPDQRQKEWGSRSSSYSRDSLGSGSNGSRVSPTATPMSPYHGSMPKQDTVRLAPLTPSGNTSMNQKMANMAAAVASRQNSSPMSTDKLPERPKRLLPMQSFKEAELSDELHKALTKRQNIINNAPKETNNNAQETISSSPSQDNSNFKFNLKPVSQKHVHVENSSVNSQPPWASEVKHFAKSQEDTVDGPLPKTSSTPPKPSANQKTTRQPSVRGPKPPPPKRTCSLSESEPKLPIDVKSEPLVLEEAIDEDSFDLDPPVDDASVGLTVRSIAAMLEPHKYTTPVQVVGRRSRSNSTRTPTTPLSPTTSDDAFVFPKPSDFKKSQQPPQNKIHEVHHNTTPVVTTKPVIPFKPPVQAKPSNIRPSADKPQVLKKPTLKVQPNSHKPVPQAQKLSFDLSVLDEVEKNRKNKESPKVSPFKTSLSTKQNFYNNDDLSDDFDWPAPPPDILTMPSEVPEPLPKSEPKTQMLHKSTTPSVQYQNNTSPVLPQPQSLRTPPTEPKTCFEKDDDQGTVKRRPNSYTRVPQPQNEPVSKKFIAPPLPPKDHLPPATKAATDRRMSELDDILHEINSEIAICSTQSSSVTSPPVSSTCPILPPKQTSIKKKVTNIEPQISEENAIFEEPSSPDKKSAQQVLDDIGSMFADLELELDGLLS